MDIQVVSSSETDSGYHADILLDNQIEGIDFSITEKENFKQTLKKKIMDTISRKNLLKFGIMTGEIPIPIESCDGTVAIPAIDLSQINKRKKAFPENDRGKISWIHVSTVQIIIKSTFMKGIDSPLDLVLEDSRISDPNLAIIAKGNCNLKHGKVKFDVNLQIGLSLKDKDLNRSILVGYSLRNPRLMKEGNHPFSISYKINYALSNSHHSIEFRNKDKIFIDELFEPVVQLESPILLRVEGNNRLLENSSRGYFSHVNPPKELQSSLDHISEKLEILNKKI